MDASLTRTLAGDLTDSIASGNEIGRVTCQVNGQRVISDPIQGQERQLPAADVYDAAVALGCALDQGVAVYHTHPNVSDVILSPGDVQAVARNEWIAKLCAVTRDGVGCWTRRNLNLTK